MKRFALIAFTGLLCATASPAWTRTWTLRDGRHSTEAEPVAVEQGKATLKKPDGTGAFGSLLLHRNHCMHFRFKFIKERCQCLVAFDFDALAAVNAGQRLMDLSAETLVLRFGIAKQSNCVGHQFLFVWVVPLRNRLANELLLF